MSKKWQVAELGLLNKRTGELYDAEIRLSRRSGGKFMKVWQGTGWETKLDELQGNSLKVLFHLTMIAGWNNLVPGPTETSKVMSLRQPHVSRAYTQLTKANFLIKQNGTYHLSPFYCWKGNDQHYEQACRELTGDSKLALVGH